jgi:hypothetical protein
MIDYVIVEPGQDACRGCRAECITKGTECNGPDWPARSIARPCRECGDPAMCTHVYHEGLSTALAEYCPRCAHDLRMLGAAI